MVVVRRQGLAAFQLQRFGSLIKAIPRLNRCLEEGGLETVFEKVVKLYADLGLI
jgi:hypothetical protein